MFSAFSLLQQLRKTGRSIDTRAVLNTVIAHRLEREWRFFDKGRKRPLLGTSDLATLDHTQVVRRLKVGRVDTIVE